MTSSPFFVRAALTTVLLAFLFAGASFVLAQPSVGTIKLTVTDQNGEQNDTAEIVQGESVTLSWYGENVENCIITPGDIEAEDTLSETAYMGYTVVTPDENSMTYQISCEGINDAVEIMPAPEVSLDVDYETVELFADNSLSREPTITWETNNVSSCGDVERRIPGSVSFSEWESDIEVNSTESQTEEDISRVGTYQYRLTCTGPNGENVSAGTSFEVDGITPESTLTFTASPTSITANSAGRGTVTLTWSTENISRCHQRIDHNSPSVNNKQDQWINRSTAGTLQIELTEPGEHEFKLGCYRDDGAGERIVKFAYATLNYDDVTIDEPELTLTADPDTITLTPMGGIERTELTWGGGAIGRCSEWLERRAPSEDDFRNFKDVGQAVSGSVYDYEISETGTYVYRRTCYAAVGGREVRDTANVNVGGEANLISAVSIDANPRVVTPDPSTGLATTNLTWSHENVLQSDCRYLGEQSPSRRDENGNNSFSALTSAPQDNTSGVHRVNGINEYGTWTYRIRCPHPTTRDMVVDLVDVVVQEAELLPANMELEARLAGNRIVVDYSSANYTSCSAIEKRVGSGGWFEFNDASENVNTNGSLTDNSTLTTGTYSYRMTCKRPIEDREDLRTTQVTYTAPPVTNTASVNFLQCRDRDGIAISIPDGYEADGEGNCVPTGVLGDINLFFESPLIRAGDTAEITWEYTGNYEFDACFLQGPGIMDLATGNPTNRLLVNVVAGVSGTAQTDPRYATSLYSLACTDAIAAEPLASERIRLEVVPTYQEV